MCDDTAVTNPLGPRDPVDPGYPPPGAPYGAPFPPMEPPLVQIGDITVTQSKVITPSGSFPVKGSQWVVTDRSQYSETMSQTGLVLALVGFFVVCALSLLFLLMKDRRTTGYIQVTVRGVNGVTHYSNIPALSQGTMPDIAARVGYAQTLAAVA